MKSILTKIKALPLRIAVKILIRALRKDPAYYEGWRANIAMSIKKEYSLMYYDENDEHMPYIGSYTLARLSNRAAERFLKLLTKSK